MNARAGLCPKLSYSRCKRSGRAIAGLLGAALVALLAPAAHAERLAPLVQASASDDALPGRYIVVLGGKPGTKQAKSAASALARARQRGIRADRVYSHALNGFAAKLTAAELTELRKDPDVTLIAPDQKARAAAVHQSPAPWDLDRLDQINLPLNNDFHYTSNGAGVKVYVIDSGIRASHEQFGGRATPASTLIDNALPADDCNGHGTHVAGTIGGSTYGVAKGVSLVAVRVLDCSALGSFADIIEGIDWVTAQHLPGQPAVANLSISGAAHAPLDTALNNSIADGVTYTVAAGDFGTDACGYSPARVTGAVTVGATTRTDARPSYSNIGSCLDLFAPGDDITSAWIGSDTATMSQSGTSMAAPHAAGVAAIYLQNDPSLFPATVAQRLKDTRRATGWRTRAPARRTCCSASATRTRRSRRSRGARTARSTCSCAPRTATPPSRPKTRPGRLIMAWTSLERQVLGAPAAVWTPDGETLHIYAVAPNHHIIRRRYNSWTGWGTWSPHPTTRTASRRRTPSASLATRLGDGTSSCAATGGVAKMMRLANSDGRVVHGWKYPGNGPDFLVLDAPTGSWTDDQRLNIYAVAPNHELWTIRQGGGMWGSWRRFTTGWHSETVGVADRGTSLDILVRGFDDHALRYCASTLSQYCGTEDLGKSVTSAPRGSWSPDKTTLDIVGRGEDDSIDRRRWIVGTGWIFPWTRSPVSSASVGAAGRISTPSPDVVHLLAVGNDQGAYVTGLGMNGTTPLPWSSLDVPWRITDAPGGSWDPPGNLLDVVAVGGDHKPYRRRSIATPTAGRGACCPITRRPHRRRRARRAAPTGSPPSSVAATGRCTS